MRKLVVAAILLTIPVCSGQDKSKLFVTRYDGVIFIQDLETGTRCYAIDGYNDGSVGQSRAISCVKQ